MTGPPRLTVIIPSWNAASSIERAIRSVVDDNAVRLECLVVDDGSTDGTADVVAEIARRDPRVVLVALPVNGGVSAARNRALESAGGEWLAFLDADDRLLPGAIDALMAPTDDPEVRVVIGQRIWNDGERTWISQVYDNPDIRLPGRKSIATHPGLLYYASATGKVLHRSLLDGLQFEGRVLGDQAWTIQAMLRAGQGIEVIGDDVYEWTRPTPDRYLPTITAASRASAAGATRMASMAPVVFATVSAEVDRVIDDATTRDAIKRAYFERLLRSDLSGPVRTALERRDPETGELYAAVARFIESVPAPIVSRSERLVKKVLRLPARRWPELVPTARPGYWAMVRAALRADRRMARRIAWNAPSYPPFALVAASDGQAATAAASAMMSALHLARRVAAPVRDRVRRRRAR